MQHRQYIRVRSGTQSKMRKNKRYIFVLVLSLTAFTCGCDPINRHKVLTTIFDGVPSLPPPEQICEEYAAQKIAALNAPAAKSESAQEQKVSQHLPYVEKRCDDCHDKNAENGLIRPKDQLCFVCHTDFIKGAYVHGPVAVGQCLACHVPHDSPYGPLLKVDKKELCVTCHREKRLAAALHQKATDNNLVCTDCHNPHYGNLHYFLK